MRTNMEIDDVLMREAQKVSGHATKKQTVEEALRLMIRLRRQQNSTPPSANTVGVATSLAAA
jgi:Arc/MetJ family transcription regulator